ncbi:MAG: nucleotidyltransferase domain-containing protein [Candidatus Bathyarchaeota archaeon]|nr:nucleotidyltransferase domain-containing protein [Candidatus Bathyarchaeota archaeon]
MEVQQIKMTIKPTKYEYKEATYSKRRWILLKGFRQKTIEIITALEKVHLHSVVHGSIARGDVRADSDIDIFIPEVQNSFLVEAALEKANIKINSRMIVQATPNYAMKAHIELNEKTSVSFPLMEMRRVEREFYSFGGEVNLKQLEDYIRIAGVDKRLMLIEPTETGHIESGIIGREENVAKSLGISAETVFDRVHTLLKRDKTGRTGLFIKKELNSEETFELALKRLAEANPAVRRRIKK